MQPRAPILKTKLHPPALPFKLVSRPHLIQKLHEGLEFGRGITLVSAPAGFGKTTCVSAWIHALDLPVAWLSLEPSDDDPGRFFAYFIAALQTIGPNLGHAIELALTAGQVPPGEIISATLINDLLELDRQFLLVLDDFHNIQDSAILEVFDDLVANHPWPLHLVLITREDPPLPLARLRANNKLTEIRARDLRFSGEAIGVFFQDVMALSLSEGDIAVLEAKTEGWVAGLQLAGLSIQEKEDPSNFISQLSGSHRFILSYLTEQVLDQQPEDIRAFLLQTAVLDKFNPALCNAVTQRSDAGDLLARLQTANLFLIPLDEAGQWYRYHHLFADLLRGLQPRAGAEQINALHQRASRWFAAAGMADEAIHHALAAGDYASAVQLLESHALEMIMQGYAKTVHDWVQALPEEWRTHSPRTHLAFAWMHLLRGAYAQASPYLGGLQAAFSMPGMDAEEKRSLEAEWLVMRALLLTMEGNIDASLALAEQALAIVPQGDSRVRSLVYFGLARAYQHGDDYDLVADAYQQAIQYGRASANLVTEMLSTSGLAQLAFEHGRLPMAFEIAAPVCKRLEGSPSLPPISTVVFGILGEVYYQWCQTKPARRYFQHAYQLSALGGLRSGMSNCQVLLSRTSLLQGDLEAAATEIQMAVDLLQAETPLYVRQEVVAQQVRVYLAQNRLAAAQMALQAQGFSFQDQFSYPDFPPDQRLSSSHGLLYNSSLHALLYQARADRDPRGLTPGIALANRLIDGIGRGQPVQTRLEALLLRARMHAELGDLPASQADYLRALELGEPGGFMGVFLEHGPPAANALSKLVRQASVDATHLAYANSILAAFSRVQHTILDKEPAAEPPTSAQGSALMDPLTDRELQVLRLMAAGLTYKEIAAWLFISLNTVRYHVKAIYAKFNVNNRTQALEQARQLRIL